MMKRPNEGDNNARVIKAMRTEESIAVTSTELDGKIIGSRFDVVLKERPIQLEEHTAKGRGGNAAATTTITTIATSQNETFPEKLASILLCEKTKDTIWWNKEGNAFAMIPKNFTEKILQKVFQGTKLESFQRKMKRWGFERCLDTSFPRGALVYRHPLFQRDRPELMSKMSAGMRKITPLGITKAAVSIPSRTINNDMHLLSSSSSPPTQVSTGRTALHVPTVLPPYAISAVERMSDSYARQQIHNQLLAAERLRLASTICARMQSQAAVRNMCLQTLQDRERAAMTASYLHQTLGATNGTRNVAAMPILHSSDPTFVRQVPSSSLPTTGLNVSNMSTRSLLQLREFLLSRTRNQNPLEQTRKL